MKKKFQIIYLFKFRYHVDPNSVVVDFTSSGDAWYDSVELTKFVAGDNAITEIDTRLAEEFGALRILDVSGHAEK